MIYSSTHSRPPSEHDDVLSVIRQWEADVVEYRKQLREFNDQMTAKIQSKERKIEHLKKLVPVVAADDSKLGPRRKHARGRARLTWHSVVLDVINQSERGLTYSEILDRTLQTVLAKRRSKGDKGFYKALANLVANGEIVKNGKTVYSLSLAEAMRARGEPLVETESVRRGGKGLIFDILNRMPNGMRAADIKATLIAHPNAPESARKHSQYIYNMLKQLIDENAVTKTEDGIYKVTK